MAKIGNSAKDKLRAYFLSNIGKVLNSYELREVAVGQTEWGRRVRELRDEMGGTDDPANLRAICSICNEGASNTTLTRPDLHKLLIQIRRATNGDH